MRRGTRVLQFAGIMTLTASLLVGCGSGAKNENTLIVGLECNYAPFNWTQTASSDTAVAINGGGGYCDGYDVVIASRIADELGKTLVVKKTAWEALESGVALNSGDIDMVVAGMTDTAKRRNSLDFSAYYYSSDMVLIVRKDSVFASATSLADFTGAKVVAQKGTLHDDLVDQIPEVNHMTPLGSFPVLYEAVKSKDADAAVSERPVAQAAISANPDLMIVSFAEGQGFDVNAEDVTVSIAVKKGNTDLVNAINGVLAKISKEDREQIMADAIARQPE